MARLKETLSERVVRALKREKTATCATISAGLGANSNAVNQVLHRLVDDGLVHRTEGRRPTYALAGGRS